MNIYFQLQFYYCLIRFHDSSTEETDKIVYSKSQLFYFATNPYDVTIHSNRLDETIRMNGHIIGLAQEFLSYVKETVLNILT